jgi:predicted ribosomally synthesized peptide with nif11-like leader
MSKKDALLFLKKISDDPLLTAKLRGSDKDNIVKIAEEIGYFVSLEELKQVSREIKGSMQELSDEDLDMVVGGISSEEIAAWAEDNIDKLVILYENIP